MSRICSRLVMFGAFGWIVAIAISALLIYRIGIAYPQFIAYENDPIAIALFSRDQFVDRTGLPCPVPSSPSNAFLGRGIETWGCMAVRWDFLDTTGEMDGTADGGTCFEVGWPLANFRRETSVAMPIELFDIAQMQVQWVGMIVDTVVWSVPLLPFLWLAGIRVRRRRSRGQCSACGYPLSGAHRCPECGVAVGERRSVSRCAVDEDRPAREYRAR